MAFFNDRRSYRNNYTKRRDERAELADPANSGNAGLEASYLKSLVDSRAKITVVLKTGERLQGRIRYYDRDCFSLGPAGGGPKIFLRKSSVCYISEE